MAPPRDLNTHHLFTPPPTRTAWEARAKEVRQRILLACGLLPLPEKGPLRPQETGRIELPDITVENIALETLPGFFLCGNLYRPKGKGPFPAIANPHGHWNDGRCQREPDVPHAAPPPTPPAPGRADLVNLAATLARQGFVVFAYDMVGYNDTDQLPHRQLGTQLTDWLWGVSELGLQTWNSIRVLDYLESLPFVDKKRLGVTGASGGGTQTFLLAAIDPRIKVSVPVNMVSAYMQGGCNCENAPGLRVGTDNPEIAALFAPKPQLLVCCTGDWTSRVPQEEGPAVAKVYDLYRAGESFATVQFNYQHNYNVESREAMTAFFRKHLLHAPAEAERPLELDPKRLRVRRPTGKTGPQVRAALRNERQQTAEQLRSRTDSQATTLKRTALALALAVDAPKKRSRSARRVALVVGESEAAVAPLVAALERRKRTVERLIVAPLAADPKALQANFFSCYNRTPIGDRVQAIVDRVGETKAGTIDLIGVGGAGAATVFARALLPGLPGATAADLTALGSGDDTAYLSQAFAPGLLAAGGAPSAASLIGGPLQLSPLSTDELAEWVVSQA